jgi:hypothetical protein
LLNTPKLTEVKVNADTSAAAAALQALADRFGYIQIHAVGGSGGRAAFAGGGLVKGVGTGTSDSNVVAVSNEEYIVRASKVAQPGVLAELNRINFGTGAATVVKPQIPMYGLGGGASGAGPGSLLQAIERALSARPAASSAGPLAIFNYSGTQAPTPEQQAIMVRRLASLVTG